MESQAETPGAGYALVVVSTSVLLATSTWFTGSAIGPALTREWQLSGAEAAMLTTSVQVGFVVGTFLYSISNLSDIFNPRRVFLASALLGGLLNAGFAYGSEGLGTALILRFLTGITFAGVYPVGMKIIASWFRSGLGWRLGVMVGALTLGTASPWLVRALGADLPWRPVAAISSGAAALGGLLVLLALRDGPYLKGRARFDAQVMFRVFAFRNFRLTAFGYFGHMWELYAFWAMVGFYLHATMQSETLIPWLVFAAIGIGALGCAGGGWVSRIVGERRVALTALVGSGLCCALAGFAFELPQAAVGAFVLLWGLLVVADSPQFSALAAKYCPSEYTGTALTVQNGVGFAITVGSIQLLPVLAEAVTWQWAFLALLIGPVLGSLAMWRLGVPVDGDRPEVQL